MISRDLRSVRVSAGADSITNQGGEGNNHGGGYGSMDDVPNHSHCTRIARMLKFATILTILLTSAPPSHAAPPSIEGTAPTFRLARTLRHTVLRPRSILDYLDR